jgi:hypothetical protein
MGIAAKIGNCNVSKISEVIDEIVLPKSNSKSYVELANRAGKEQTNFVEEDIEAWT